jgi:hypothetical protein
MLSRLPSALPRRAAIPLPDARALRGELRRTTLIRAALLVALIALGVLAVWRAATIPTRTVSFLPKGQTAIVVLDQSKSVYLTAYRRIAVLIRRLVDADASIGLIGFSDTAYELLPPGTHGTELRPLLRYYQPNGGGAVNDETSSFSANPWEVGFSGGTKISSGVSMAERVVARDRLAHATVLLVSDLGTASEDRPLLTRTLIRFGRNPHVTLRIVPLFPVAEDRTYVERLVGKQAFVSPGSLSFERRGESHTRFLGSTPTSFVVVAALLLVALAVNELLCARVYVPRPQEAS